MKRFQAPVVLEKLLCHPVQKLGMAGRFSQCTEIIGGRDNACAEMVLPDAVDDHSGAERILFAGQPVGEGGPSAG